MAALAIDEYLSSWPLHDAGVVARAAARRRPAQGRGAGWAAPHSLAQAKDQQTGHDAAPDDQRAFRRKASGVASGR